VKATCYPGFGGKLEGAEYIDSRVVEDGKYVLANGPSSALLWALKIVACELGEEKSREVAAGMLLYPQSENSLDNIFG
ncbi:MAG: DJ-1/PfpI family protein, partial [Muribaculaceae bacterium]|nr:DJ-1/PfpI family protein [Muribaculaceae bacterium]